MKDNSRKRPNTYVYIHCVMGKGWEFVTFYRGGNV